LLALQNVMNQVSATLAQNSVLTFQATLAASPIPVPPPVAANFSAIITSALGAANSSAQIMLNTQAAQDQYNLTALLVPFVQNFSIAQAALNAQNAQAAALLDQIQADNNKTYQLYLVEQAAQAAAAAALVNVSHALNAFGQALINALAPLVNNGGSPNFDAVGSFLANIATWGANQVEDGINAVNSLAGGIPGAISGLFGSALGGISTTIVIIVVVVVILGFLMCILPMCIKPGMPCAIGGGGGATATTLTPQQQSIVPAQLVQLAAAAATAGRRKMSDEDLIHIEEQVQQLMKMLEVMKKQNQTQGHRKKKRKPKRASASSSEDDDRKETDELQTIRTSRISDNDDE